MSDAKKPPPMLIEKVWQDFSAKLIPAATTDGQLRDMRMAFYSGAFSVFTLMMEAAEYDERRAERILAALGNELEAFVASMSITSPR